jgi:hypothetical protein
MGTFDLEGFKTGFEGGARGYLFMYEPNASSPLGNQNRKYLVRATSMPETSEEEIIVNWQGMDFKMSGKKTFNDWTVTFNTDYNALIRIEFEKWSNFVHLTMKGGKYTNIYGKPIDYMFDQKLSMLGYEGERILDVHLIDAWPKSVGAITLDYSAQDVAQFDVTFSYQSHEIDKDIIGGGG